MKPFRIVNGFDRLTDSKLLTRAQFIKASLTDNPHFPNPVPSLADLSTAISALEAAIQKAATGNKQDIMEKSSVQQHLINQLHLLGNYVLFMSAGNPTAATSSGFTINKPQEPVAPITAPTGLVLKSGLNRGELVLKFKNVAGAKCYQYEMTAAPVTTNSVWEIKTSTLSKNLFSGLQSGKEFSFRVAAIGPRQQVVYSDVVSRIAL